ncbi:hypothetical protein BKA66DRAFT_407497 [Pyrenochaeta sp. MPI-SDFR-AT-0127]|nr:hypothetical protein BKA66DRAFT_407497 [Pyrenochaeta sp. MPI-SDFR-AT-0127]
MTSDPQATCSTCDKPATDKCGGCKAITYCSKDCQIKDWPKHKKTCKDFHLEKIIARAADFIQQAFFGFSEQTWDTPIIKIEEHPRAIVIYYDDQKQNKSYFVKFPENLMVNQKMKMSVLCALKCEEPLGWMSDLLKSLLEGLNITIEEVNLALESIPRNLTYVMPNGAREDIWPRHTHAAFRVTSSKTKRQWILDISGPQYGIYKNCWEWPTYQKSFAATLIRAYPSGTHESLFKIVREIKGNPSLTHGVVGDAAKCHKVAATNWAKENGMSLSYMMTLEDEVFEQQKSHLLKAMNGAVVAFVKTGNYAAKVRAARAYTNAHPGKAEMECMQASQLFFNQLDNLMTN